MHYLFCYYYEQVDQASIVGGAINYVKELEHQLQLLSGQNFEGGTSSSSPFAEFFSFPQYSTSSSSGGNLIATTDDPWGKENKIAAMADIEVTMVESHANLKIRSKTRPKQLIKMVNGLQSLRLTILHLSVTTVDQVALYSLCVKVSFFNKFLSKQQKRSIFYHLRSIVVLRWRNFVLQWSKFRSSIHFPVSSDVMVTSNTYKINCTSNSLHWETIHDMRKKMRQKIWTSTQHKLM